MNHAQEIAKAKEQVFEAAVETWRAEPGEDELRRLRFMFSACVTHHLLTLATCPTCNGTGMASTGHWQGDPYTTSSDIFVYDPCPDCIAGKKQT